SESRSTSCRRRPSSGISTCAATAPCRTAGSGWASNEWCRGSASSITCARRFHIRECCTGCTLEDDVLGSPFSVLRSCRERRTQNGERRTTNAMKIGLVSLGCPKNLVDSEVMLGLAREAGHELTNDATAADVLVVNTCAFIDSAKQESIDTILEMAQHKAGGACRRLIVTGCLAERYREELKTEIPEIDAVLGTGEVPQIVQAIGGVTMPRVSPLTFFTTAGTPSGTHLPARTDADAFATAWPQALHRAPATLPTYIY